MPLSFVLLAKRITLSHILSPLPPPPVAHLSHASDLQRLQGAEGRRNTPEFVQAQDVWSIAVRGGDEALVALFFLN